MTLFSHFQNIFLLMVYLFSEKSYSFDIRAPSDGCSEGYEYNNLVMGCIDNNQFKFVEPYQYVRPTDGETEDCNEEEEETGRDDKIKCININKDCPNKGYQRNYFGFFEEETICAGTQPIQNFYNYHQNIDYDCSNEYMIICQNLANFCALNYRDNKNTFNSECEKLNGITGDKPTIEMNITDTVLPIRYTLDPNALSVANYHLNFHVARFFTNGTLDKMEFLESDFLQCSNSKYEKLNYKVFGFNFHSECFIDITKYKNNKQNYFYEIFLETNSEQDSNRVLTPIPIKIINVNKVVKRMFLYSYVDPEVNGGSSFYYAEKVVLNVRTSKDSQKNEEHIYLPYFSVEYKEYSGNADYIKYTFESIYQSEDIKNFMKAALIIMVVFLGLSLIIAIYRTYVWYLLNPPQLIPDKYALRIIVTFIYKLFKFAGIVLFLFCFGISFYWYVIYKLQYRVYFLMPNLEESKKQYTQFKIVFFVGFVIYMIFMFIRIYRQCSFDIFFIDWESEKNMVVQNALKTLDNNNNSIQYKKYRSAWRMIHVVNQFNKLQTERTINLYFAFSWIVLLYYKVKWERNEHQNPKISKQTEVDDAPTNFILRHFLASIIIMVCGLADLILTKLLQIWLPLKKQEFLDLCSVANISVFILDDILHGYYLHGMSPIGKADVNYDELLQFLKAEGSGHMRNRGLENDRVEEHEENQTYEMFISYRMRTIYDGLYLLQTESMLAQSSKSQDRFKKKSKLGYKLFKNYLNQEKNSSLLENYMNNQLKNKIDIISSSASQYIRDKPCCQKFLDYPIENSDFLQNNIPDIVLYREYGINFDDILFCGMELEFFVMDVFIFQFWMIIIDIGLKKDYGSGDSGIIFLSIFLTWLCDRCIHWLRGFWGIKNVSEKAVIDENFLDS